MSQGFEPRGPEKLEEQTFQAINFLKCTKYANYSMWQGMHTISSFDHSFYSMESKEILIKFGQRVRKLRKEKKLSQEDVSFKADLHRTYIGMIERAEKNITLANIEKIAKALNVNIKELFDD